MKISRSHDPTTNVDIIDNLELYLNFFFVEKLALFIYLNFKRTKWALF